jgi:cob(I)alamin adenosyltransferase
MKIYTKTGDKGETSLYGGKRVPKSDLRIEAIGAVDELNAYLGMITATCHSCEGGNLSIDPCLRRGDKTCLTRVQNELFTLGADLATPSDVNSKLKILRVTELQVTQLEKEIDVWTLGLPELKNFILPGGSQVGAQLHYARTICRRAERSVVKLAEFDPKLNKHILHYLNRLSDWLFVLARKVNLEAGAPEQLWQK